MPFDYLAMTGCTALGEARGLLQSTVRAAGQLRWSDSRRSLDDTARIAEQIAPEFAKADPAARQAMRRAAQAMASAQRASPNDADPKSYQRELGDAADKLDRLLRAIYSGAAA